MNASTVSTFIPHQHVWQIVLIIFLGAAMLGSLLVILSGGKIMANSVPLAPAVEQSIHGAPSAASDSAMTSLQASPATYSATSQITITANGFVPSVLTVTIGSAVTWTNGTNQTQALVSGEPWRIYLPLIQRQASHATAQIVSAPQLTHPDIATAIGNNSLFSATLTPDSSFVYTFTVPGVYSYFLATAPQLTGRIIATYELNAPPLDDTVATTLISATGFLYTGPNPIQTGVVPGTINPIRVAVLRGRILDRDDQPQPGVKITILNHPEFGQTLSRADGMFDMVVNGGGLLVLEYAKAGYLLVQRQLDTPWQDYMWAPDVVLIPHDSQVTAITLTAPFTMQVAQGSVISDSDGIRQATLLFPQGVTATAILPGGISQTLSTLHVRATEFTVGPNGSEAMPAPLPLASGYTYAVELSVDEADTMGAGDVVFSQPIINYVDNFLSFPAGITVPVGYYDPDKAVWIASDNGLVIKIVTMTGGLADLDTDGDDVADDPATLAALGITDAERVRLAGLYSAGQSLWRVPITHFSSWDANWGTRCKYDLCDRPDQPPPEPPSPDDQCTTEGSVIACQNQTLGEVLPVVGTPFDLAYTSERVPGRASNYYLEVPLTGDHILETMLHGYLDVSVAGRTFREEFPAAPNQRTIFTWDGRDAFGRRVQGSQPVQVAIGYAYEMEYVPTGRFGYNGWGNPITNDLARGEFGLWLVQNVYLPVWNAKAEGLGGWSLDVHHSYDPQGHVLYLGDGTRRNATNLVARTVAGRGGTSQGCDGLPATQAFLNALKDVATAPDGSYYVALATEICKVDADGIITTVVSAPEVGEYPQSVAVAPDGSLYFADTHNNRVRRLGTDGTIITIAGNGSWVYSGDGGPATQAGLSPVGIAVGPDGSVYIADESNNRIRRVGTDGIISTFAGNGSFSYGGDGGPAVLAQLKFPRDVATAQDGSVYIDDRYNHRVRQVSASGIITTIAGTGGEGYSGDGGPATLALLGNIQGIAVGPDNSVYIAEYDIGRIRRISPDGLIITVAGTGLGGRNGDGRPASQTNLMPYSVDVAPDNTLMIVTCSEYCSVAQVTSPMPGFMLSDIAIPSEDGSELYQFDYQGRHLRTLNALTGGVLYQFGYDSVGRLITVTDGAGNVTTIERDATGNPTALVAPFGQRTLLALDANGYLSRVTNPAGETRQFSYTDDGLLTSLTDPRQNVFTYTYDALGRLVKAQDPVGGYKEFTRTELANGFIVSLTTALSRTTSYQVERLTTGERRLIYTFPDGTRNQGIIGTNGSQTITYTDGTVASQVTSPDPRWGMMAPVRSSIIISTPGSLSSVVEVTRTASLTNPGTILSLNLLTTTTAINGRIYTTTFTSDGRVFTDTTPSGRQTSTIVDAQGQPVQEWEAGLEPLHYIYDSHGRVAGLIQGTGILSRSTTVSYDAAGYLSAITDAAGRTTGFVYDSAGRVTQQTLPAGQVITDTYDANSNLTSITPPGRPPHAFTYTVVNLMGAYLPPEVGGGGGQTRYLYNDDRQLARIVRPDGQEIIYGYDAAGRLTTLTIPDGRLDYAYDAATGNLTTIANSRGVSLSYAYNSTLITRTTCTGVVTGTVDRAYDDNFRTAALTVTGGTSVTFQYDVDGRLVRSGDLTLMRNAQNGLLSSATLDNVTDTWSYNGFGEPITYTAFYSGTPLIAVQYARDELGRIIQKTEMLGGVTDVYSYIYDLAGRLSVVQKNNITIASYTYDSNGNRLSFTGPGGTVYGSYDDQDRLLQYGATVYTYTTNGELLSKANASQMTTYHYDALGNLLSLVQPDDTQVEYVVDGRNQRVGKRVNGVLQQVFLYQEDLRPVAELDGAGHIVSRFVYGTRVNVPEYMIRGDNTYRLILDQIGSPRLVIDVSTGQIAQQLAYNEYGNVTADTHPGFQPFGFAGGLYDPDTGLVRFGVRDYDAASGRWTAKDPTLFEGDDTNLYGYVSGDPINRTDITGKKDSCESPHQCYLDCSEDVLEHPIPGLEKHDMTTCFWKCWEPVPDVPSNDPRHCFQDCKDAYMFLTARDPEDPKSRDVDSCDWMCYGNPLPLQ